MLFSFHIITMQHQLYFFKRSNFSPKWEEKAAALSWTKLKIKLFDDVSINPTSESYYLGFSLDMQLFSSTRSGVWMCRWDHRKYCPDDMTKKKTWIMFWYKTSVPGYFMLSDKLSTICLCFMFLLWNKLLLLCTKHRKKNFLSTFYLCPTQGTLFNFQGAIRACHVSTRAKHCRNQSRQADAAQQGIFKHRKSLLNPLKWKNKK